MNPPLTPEQLDACVLAYLDGTINAEAFDQLTQTLRNNPTAQDRFVELATLDRCLLDTLVHDGQVQAMQQVNLEQADAALPFEQKLALLARGSESAEVVTLHGELKPRQPWMPYALGGAIAAVLILSVTLIITLSGPDNDPASIADGPTAHMPAASAEPTPRGSDSATNPTVATLTATHNAVWAEGASAPGSQLRAGQRLTLTTGFAEITTARGAIAILEAPAKIQLTDNPNALRLHNGKLVGICESPSSKGFLVRTPHMDITDLGTEFGVEVHDNTVTTTVFTGEVEIETTTGQSHRLTNNQTARIDTTGDRPELIIEDRVAEGFARRIPRAGLVKKVRINDDRFKVEVLAQGVVDGAKPFTDRRYILKGSNGQGIPAELSGGDLVRIPANARSPYSKATENLRVELDLAEPARVYLLFVVSGEDQSLPQWVTRDYEPTPLALTLAPDPAASVADERAPNDFTLDTDQALHVWKRKRIASRQTVVAEQMLGGFTYTLVVVPEQAGESIQQP